MSKLCFYVKLMIDRILQICIMQFCLQFKTHNTKKLSYFCFFFSIIFSCVFALDTQPPWRNWLARSAVNRKVGGSSPPGGGKTF